MSRSPARAVRIGAAAVVQAVVTLVFYRWRIGDDNLTPHRPSDIVALFLASVVGVLAALPIGPAPGIWLTSDGYDIFANKEDGCLKVVLQP